MKLKEGCEGRWAKKRDRDMGDVGEGMEARLARSGSEPLDP